MFIKITQLKKAEEALVGMKVPTQEYGNIGNICQDVMIEQGYNFNKGKGADLLDIEVEVKSRGLNATSAQTIGSMLPKDTAVTDYEDSVIFEKFQQQFRIHHVEKLDGTTEIVSAKMYNFALPKIQSQVKVAYETGRQIIIDQLKNHNGRCDKYIRGTLPDGTPACGYWEKTVKTSNSYDFRLPDNVMREFETIAINSANTLFTFEE
jgi:hypothetical protein